MQTTPTHAAFKVKIEHEMIILVSWFKVEVDCSISLYLFFFNNIYFRTNELLFDKKKMV